MAASLGFLTKSLLNLRLSTTCYRWIHTQETPLNIHVTSALWGVPMKKKRKVDPQLVIMREQKKKRKIEKQIRRLEKYAQKLKPIEEIQISNQLRQETKLRQRQNTVISFEESEERVKLVKQWTQYQQKLFGEEMKALALAELAQQKALTELRKESEELYQMAIQMDDKLIPFKHEGPVYTMAISDYNALDGEYNDTSRKWD